MVVILSPNRTKSGYPLVTSIPVKSKRPCTTPKANKLALVTESNCNMAIRALVRYRLTTFGVIAGRIG